MKTQDSSKAGCVNGLPPRPPRSTFLLWGAFEHDVQAKTAKTALVRGLVLVLSALASGAGAQVWNLTTDFSTNANPSGAWSYGYLMGNPSTANLTLFTNQTTIASFYSGPAWYADSTTSLDLGVLASSVPSVVAARAWPDSRYYAIARWTAGEEADYRVQVAFSTESAVNVALWHNGEFVFGEVISAQNKASFGANYHMLPGESLDFSVNSANFLPLEAFGGGASYAAIDATVTLESICNNDKGQGGSVLHFHL